MSNDIIRMARESGIKSGDSYKLTVGHMSIKTLERFAAIAQAAERNKLAAWMIAQGYATGHGETMEGLLEELEREVGFKRAELWIKRISEAVLAEREALAKFFEDHWRERWTDEQIVDEIRARKTT